MLHEETMDVKWGKERDGPSANRECRRSAEEAREGERRPWVRMARRVGTSGRERREGGQCAVREGGAWKVKVGESKGRVGGAVAVGGMVSR